MRPDELYDDFPGLILKQRAEALLHERLQKPRDESDAKLPTRLTAEGPR